MPLAPLATVADLEARLERALAGAERTRAERLLDDASAAVREWTGQHFTQATTTISVRPKRGKVRLPQRPVTAVTTVTDVAGNPLLFEWLGSDRVKVTLTSFEIEGTYTGLVKVTYTHGYAADEIPRIVVAIVCQIAGRALGQKPEDTGKTQESLGEYAYAVGAAAAAGAVGMLSDERLALERYKRSAGSVDMLQ